MRRIASASVHIPEHLKEMAKFVVGKKKTSPRSIDEFVRIIITTKYAPAQAREFTLRTFQELAQDIEHLQDYLKWTRAFTNTMQQEQKKRARQLCKRIRSQATNTNKKLRKAARHYQRERITLVSGGREALASLLPWTACLDRNRAAVPLSPFSWLPAGLRRGLLW